MSSVQNYGPFWGTPNTRCRIIVRTQKGTRILTTTHIPSWDMGTFGFWSRAAAPQKRSAKPSNQKPPKGGV